MNKNPILITGATSGLGRKVAIEIAKSGWPVIVGGRNPQSVAQVCTEIQHYHVETEEFLANLASLQEVSEAIEKIRDKELGGIVTNAGITTEENLKTEEGFELTFGVNVLSHHLILRELAGNLSAGSRVVILSSGVHEPDNKLARRAGIPVPNWLGTRELAYLNRESSRSDFPGRLRYSTSKLGNVLQARAFQEYVSEQNKEADVFAVDPGLMVDTELARELPGPLKLIFRGVGRILTPFVDNMRLSEVSARDILSLLTDPKWSGKGFAYLDGNRIKPPSPDARKDELKNEYWQAAEQLMNSVLSRE